MLSYDFFQKATHVCLYGLHKNTHFPMKCIFPSATTIAVLRCSSDMIPSLITNTMFPRLHTVHYLSGHPGSTELHRRGYHWIFPNRAHPFYDHMVEAGHGRRDPSLIRRYITGSYCRVHLNDKTFDLQIPGYHIVNDHAYRSALLHYMRASDYAVRNPTVSFPPTAYRMREDMVQIPDAFRISTPQQRYLQEKIDNSYFDCILREER